MTYHQPPNIGDIRKGIVSKYFINNGCNCNYTIKVNGACDYRGEF